VNGIELADDPTEPPASKAVNIFREPHAKVTAPGRWLVGACPMLRPGACGSG
jgi:hypothetical protein